MAFLEVSNISKKFGSTEVLKDVGFSLEKGEVMSIIGSSGSGKTTLLRCLNSLETPDSGSIDMGGQTVNYLGGGKKVGSVDGFGLVFQNFNLFPQYTALKNITLAMDIIAKEKLKKQKLFGSALKSALDAEKELNLNVANELLKKVDLSDKANLYPYQLSGGQCQRVAIARALALKPAVLCFDEPTSALDPLLTNEVLAVIRSLKSSDMTMIIVTHEMEFARGVSDKVAFMSDGIIETMGTPQQIFNQDAPEKLQSFLGGTRQNF